MLPLLIDSSILVRSPISDVKHATLAEVPVDQRGYGLAEPRAVQNWTFCRSWRVKDRFTGVASELSGGAVMAFGSFRVE